MLTPDELLATRPRHPRPVPATAVVDLLRDLVGDALALRPGAAGLGGLALTGATLSTARTLPGDLYAALPGARAHGADHAAAAVVAGAVAVLTDPPGSQRLPDGVAALVVPDPRRVLGEVAALVYGRPSEQLSLVGVTGTQGKTTTTRLAEAGLLGAGVPAAVVGTVGTRVLGEDLRTSLTTPEAPDLQGLFAAMVERGVEACAMEVSSHALVLGRVDATTFDVGVFLNLGRDHLDFHADVEDYYLAKASLLAPGRSRRGLVNVDDEHGRRLVREASAEGVPVATFSATGSGPGVDADWRAVEVRADSSGSTFTLLGPGGLEVPAGVPLPGAFNVANALAAVAACAEAGHDPVAVAAAVAAGPGVPGRLERVEAGQGFTVVVDYAHKPDAVEAALATLRPLTDGRLLVVLGAGGDRDRGKRPVMGEIAARHADVLVVTDDNPRSEDPAAIRAEVLAGARAAVPLRAELHDVGDRRAAVRAALAAAAPGDVVLVAGKGHETGQEVAGQVHPFDDRVVVREELAALLGRDRGEGGPR